MSCKLDDLAVLKNGAPTNFYRKKASRIVSQKSHTITVDLGVGREPRGVHGHKPNVVYGKFSDFCFGCDLGKGYITINAEYHT
jgi:N-acetylglutamate synthase/N-acetylornithine aminotransferase